MTKKKGLGRGLAALIQEEDDKSNRVEEIEIKKIIANKYQPRYNFSEESIIELAKSIEENGLLQPIIVRKSGKNYEIVAGERRYRAFKYLKRETISAIVKEISDENSAKLALIENIQREDLNIIEEARGYRELMEKFNLTQEELSDIIGKSRSYIANTIRLLNLEEEVISLLMEEKITSGHGKILVGLKKKLQVDLANKVASEDLSVRELERLSKIEKEEKKSKTSKENKDIHLREIESSLMEIFGTKVKINNKGSKGKIEIEYYSLEDFDRLMEKFNS